MIVHGSGSGQRILSGTRKKSVIDHCCLTNSPEETNSEQLGKVTAVLGFGTNWDKVKFEVVK